MPDFPLAVPDLPDSSVSETLFTMHGNIGHVPATNRILLNLRALAGKMGIGASLPSGPGVLRQSGAANSTLWGLLQNADIGNAVIAAAKLVGPGAGSPGTVARTTDGTNVAYAKLQAGDYAAGSIAAADVAAKAIDSTKIFAPNTSGVLRATTAANAAAFSPIFAGDITNGEVTTPKMAAAAAAGFKGLQYNTAQSVAQPAAAGFTGMAGTTLSINALGGPILFGVSLLDFGCSLAASINVQIWEGSSPLASITNEVVPAGLYKATTNMVLINGITAGAHGYYLVWKSTAGTITANAVCFWALEIKPPIQGA